MAKRQSPTDLRKTMTKALFTRPFQPHSGSNELPIRRALANFLSKHAGIDCVFEAPYEQLDWSDYDLVLPYAGLFDCHDSYHRHYVRQLKRSIANGQPRAIHFDDPYFRPLSALKQAGFDDADEYTHALMLDITMPVYDQFARYSHWWSDSVLKAVKLQCPMWACPVDLTGMAQSVKLQHRALYAGYPKDDRVQLMSRFESVTFGKWHYAQYLQESADSLACVMMNSPSHSGFATLRLHESAALSIQIWPDTVRVSGLTPRRDRVFSTNAELVQILDKLSQQTEQQRSDEISAQLHKVDLANAEQVRAWVVYGGQDKLTEALC